ncbi:MAG: spheroidene monooxygenase [Gemmobacter sp.]
MTLTLARFDGARGTAFALWQMAAARIDLGRDGDVGFWKLCGSGTDGSGSGQGFTPRPNWHVWAILATFRDRATAEARLAQGQPWRRWRARAAESCTLFLEPVAARGLWAGRTPFDPGIAAGGGAREPMVAPLAALTRASVRPARALRFWARVPRIQAMVNRDPALVFGIGLGEVPLVHQITFSVWPDAAAMAAFARGNGPHGQAIRAVRDEGWFSEELYARFRVTGASGTWGGRHPLHRLKDHA